MRRREFIRLVGGASIAWPLASRAQQSKKIPTVGVLWHAGSAEEEDVYLSVLKKAFNDLGYVEGNNIHLDHRFPAENPDRFRTLAQELIDADRKSAQYQLSADACPRRRRGDRITTFFAAPQNVCFWHKADITTRSTNVRFWE
jgi:hypothetical protein